MRPPRWRLVVISGLIASGCFDPRIGEGFACGPAGECPPDQACDAAGEICLARPRTATDAGVVDPDGGPPDASVAADAGPARCGDGVVQAGEACDDGDVTDSGTCAAGCDAECTEPGHLFGPDGRCYFALGAFDFDGAQAACAARGAHLATIRDAAEDSLLDASFVPTGSAGDQWIGLTDSVVEGQFAWVTGEPITFLDFVAPEPNDDMNEDCVERNGSGHWADVECATPRTALCERELPE